ncbi:hypothetical protein GCWU000324_00478 [Kingella oralis ATCC 51147]|uniref:Uncharacterized protein n=1 Tax=Kingella oralis ATCC 51147 TaxID=629741 RepID=C4GHZ0_9NEIS|nr:hypothetical protein GCWU000324_00478 [Kingella oralis ATCC 51147]
MKTSGRNARRPTVLQRFQAASSPKQPETKFSLAKTHHHQ